MGFVTIKVDFFQFWNLYCQLTSLQHYQGCWWWTSWCSRRQSHNCRNTSGHGDQVMEDGEKIEKEEKRSDLIARYTSKKTELLEGIGAFTSWETQFRRPRLVLRHDTKRFSFLSRMYTRWSRKLCVNVKHLFVRELSHILQFEDVWLLFQILRLCGGRDYFWHAILISFGLGRTYPG